MTKNQTVARFQLYYWPIPFRGCFVSYLFAYRDVPLIETSEYDEIRELLAADPDEQGIPFMGPPLLYEQESDRCLSQMPAIVLYVSRELDLLPQDPFELAIAMKILMDCNDVLMEICRYNGSMMWQRKEWKRFRSDRLPHWLEIFEESLDRGHIGKVEATFADIGVYALFGNMMRCLPELDPDVRRHAPGIHAHCQKIGSVPSIKAYVASEEERYGNLYCGGQIEQSIRKMLATDANNEN